MALSTDILVIGGGSAGAAVAARLSENENRAVALVEAGPHYSSRESTPPDLLDGYYTTATVHDWGFQASIVRGSVMPYLRGKATGGSSAINGAIALRGAPDDFELWAKLGNDLWSWDNMLPSFCRLEDDRDFDADYHGKAGPLPISHWHQDEYSTFAARFEQSLLAAGHPPVADHNAPTATGVGPLPMNLDGRVRVSTSIGYLEPAQSRPNLTILDHHTVRQLLFEGSRVAGALMTHAGQDLEIRASAVILAAGAIGSPALLLRSGIGPAEELSRLGIECRTDLPGVGKNLLEHPTNLIAMVARDPKMPAGSEALVQVASRFTSPGSAEINDLQLFGVNGLSIVGMPQLREQVGTDSISGIGNSVQYVTSTGEITLDPSDIDGAPIIDFNCFAEAADIARAVAGVRQAWQAANSDAMSEHWQVITPLTDGQVEDDTQLALLVTSVVNPHYHAAGSCRMGPDSDPSAVVDQHLRVRGVTGLRVADASIMPTITRANTNLTAIAIAERAVELFDAS
jgi:choline dehydrogenase